ncbi:hypothetical protein PU683_07575 [Kosakonia cowanii]|uniref:hypothetical protein n=1 Tax=Kosakonia cowanii TaxID=208223 RepID=UPI0023F91003|nr:hypothetical protein [Kosakonia cowanii]MDF7759388.1 hypothetical protein [Kosakonia cowanii]
MKADAYRNDSHLQPNSLFTQSKEVPPFVNAIAVRLSWASAMCEVQAYSLLAAPYLHGSVTLHDSQQLSACFPFMAVTPQTLEDYTLMLVSLWLNIEELYYRGKLLPEEIMSGLMNKKRNHTVV